MVPGALEQDPGHGVVPVRDDRPILEAACSCSAQEARLADGERPHQNDFRAALVEESKAQLHRLRNTALEVAQFSITPRSAGTIA